MSSLAREPRLLAPISQTGLWEARQADAWLHFGGISAFPSMHVAAAVLWALIAWRRSRTLALCLWAFTLTTQIGSVFLAWHYAIDGYVATAATLGLWHVAGLMVSPYRIHVAKARAWSVPWPRELAD